MPRQPENVMLDSLEIRQLIPATPERVFQAWTNPDELKKWWGPKNVRCISAEIDLRVGGQYKIANGLPDDTVLWIIGEFETVEQPHLLIYTWAVEGVSAAPERVSVRFEQHTRGTELILKHEHIATESLRDQHQDGWFGCLNGLVKYLSISDGDTSH